MVFDHEMFRRGLVQILEEDLSATVVLGGKSTDLVQSYYAADAVTEAVVSDMLQGDDPLHPDYVAATPTINDFPTSVTIQPAELFPGLISNYRYVDPGASGDLKNLKANKTATFTFRATSGDAFIVNWSFSPKAGS